MIVFLYYPLIFQYWMFIPFRYLEASCQILHQPLHNQVISFGANLDIISLIIYAIFPPELPLFTLPFRYCAAWDAR